MKAIQHGGDIYSLSFEKDIRQEAILDFSANINPLGMPKGIKEVLIDAIDRCEAYPDPQCRKLIEAISLFEKVPKDQIVCGNGAADIIFRLVYGVKPKKAMLLAPTFSEYEEALKMVGTEIEYYYLQENGDFKVTEAITNRIHEGLDMLFICNPNNPTGQITEKELMGKILSKCEEKNVLLVVDECFNDFLDEPDSYSIKCLMKDSQQLFILKAFTKMYAIPGIRLGYGMTSNARLLECVEASGQTWSVSVLAQEAGIRAIKEKEYVEAAKQLIGEEGKYLREALEYMGMKVFKFYANYIFFKNPYKLELDKLLRQQGILIRSCKNYYGLNESFYRIAIKKHEQNRIFIEKLKEIIELNS